MRSEYTRLRRIGWRASEAFRAAKTKENFDALNVGENNEDPDGLVRFRIVEDLDGSTDVNFDGTEKEIEKVRERANQLGLWGIVGEYRLTPTSGWWPADSVWGFVGDDWRDSGYDVDIMANTLKALEDAQHDHCDDLEAFDIIRDFYLRQYTGQICGWNAIRTRALSRVLNAARKHWDLSIIETDRKDK